MTQKLTSLLIPFPAEKRKLTPNLAFINLHRNIRSSKFVVVFTQAEGLFLKFGCLVIGQTHKPSGDKGRSTLISRQSSFLGFCKKGELTNPFLPTIPTSQSGFLLGCWVISLIKGDNILGMNLRSPTITAYVKASAKL